MRLYRTVRSVAMCGLLLGLCAGFAQAKTIRLEAWDYVPQRVAFFQQKANEYRKVNPNVEIKVQVVPLADYWTKLTTSMVANIPPDMFVHHPSQIARYEKWLSPFPKDLFPVKEMERHMSFRSGFLQDGEFTLYPVGMLTSLVFYNRDLWDQAGLGAAPKTWNQLRTAGKKLTRRGGDGRMQVAGFSFANELQLVWTDLNYQLGGFYYAKDKKNVAWDTPDGRQALSMVEEMLKDGISDVTEQVTFAAGTRAMEYGWGWKRAGFKDTKGLNFGVFMLPTLEGGNVKARARSNVALGFAVPKNTPADRKAETFKFLKWLYGNDEFFVELNALMGTVPSRTSLWKNPLVLKDETFRATVQQLPLTVLTGEIPGWADQFLIEMQNKILKQGVAPRVALTQAQDKAEVEIKKNPPMWVIERETRAVK